MSRYKYSLYRLPSLLLVAAKQKRQKEEVSTQGEVPMKLSHIALSLLALAPVPAFAQEVTSSIVVSYSDLNLGSEAGVKVLDHRLANAVRSVCGAHDGSAVREFRFAAQRCMKEKSADVTALRNRAIAGYSSQQAAASR
ncbi:MAG TPA: UrcA family protein [Rhizomicrobium sp.]|nr:UrcA family protein [Rhizomicrobium sp.]